MDFFLAFSFCNMLDLWAVGNKALNTRENCSGSRINIIKTTEWDSHSAPSSRKVRETVRWDGWLVIYFPCEHVHGFFFYFSASFQKQAERCAPELHTGLGDSKFLIKICWYVVFLRFFGMLACFCSHRHFDGRNIALQGSAFKRVMSN